MALSLLPVQILMTKGMSAREKDRKEYQVVVVVCETTSDK
jgi:hypothetical protein